MSSTVIAPLPRALCQVKRLPAVLLYPEGAPGYLRHKGVAAQGALSSSSSGSSGDGALSSSLTAERLLHSVNACRARILPDKPPTQLLLPAAAVASIDAGAPSPAPAPKLPLQAAPAGGGGSAAAGAGAEAVAATAAAAPAPAAKTAAKRSVSVAAPARPPAPPTSAYGSYWTPQKSSFWGFALVFSVLLFAWDRWGLAAFDAWLVARRMHQRQAGKKFDAATNLEDIATLMILQGDGGKRQGPSGAPPAAPAGAGAGGEAAPAASPPPPPSGAASENGNGARQG